MLYMYDLEGSREFWLRGYKTRVHSLKIKRYDWLLADKLCPMDDTLYVQADKLCPIGESFHV